MRTLVKHGIILGVAISIWLLLWTSIISWGNIKFNLGLNAINLRQITGLFSILIMVLGIYLGLSSAKKNNANTITYKNAVVTGIKISVTAAVIVSLFSLTYCTIINPGFRDYMVSETEKSLRLSGKSAEEIKMLLEKARMEFSTPMQMLQGLIGQSVVGTLASLIIGAFIKTKKTNS